MYEHTVIDAYSHRHTTSQDEVLEWLERRTHLRAIHPRMLSGALQGQFLTMISEIVVPKRILEVGTFTGYSALCLAKGLGVGGVLHTIERDDEYEELIRQAICRAGRQEQIVLHIGDALSLIPPMDELFDLVYIDGDKQEYKAYYEAVLPKVRPGGVILADNVLWGGKVLEEPLPDDVRTREMASFNAKIQADPRVENVLLPLRDGLMMIRKKD